MAELSSVGTFKWNTVTVPCDAVGPSPGRDMIDVTEIDDTGPDYIAGLIDAGEFTVEINYDPDVAVYNSIVADCLAGTNRAWSLAIAGTATKTWAGNGLIKSVGPSVRAKQKITATVTIRTTGAWTYA